MSVLTEANIMGLSDLNVVRILVANCRPTILASNSANVIGGRLTTRLRLRFAKFYIDCFKLFIYDSLIL
jgi:hypothetical protein